MKVPEALIVPGWDQKQPFQVSTQHKAFFRPLDVTCSFQLRLSRVQRRSKVFPRSSALRLRAAESWGG